MVCSKSNSLAISASCLAVISSEATICFAIVSFVSSNVASFIVSLASSKSASEQGIGTGSATGGVGGTGGLLWCPPCGGYVLL